MFRLFLSLIAFFGCAASAQAALYTVELSGKVDFIFTGNAPSLDPSTIPFSVGDDWSVSFQFDDDAPNLSPGSPIGNVYGSGGFNGVVGAYNLQTPQSLIIVMNDFIGGTDTLEIQYRDDTAQDFALNLVEFEFNDPTMTAFSSNDLSASLFDPSLFDLSASFFIIAFADLDLLEFYNARLSLENLTIEELLQPVPAPAALPLFLAGAAGIGALARRRRRLA